ncbi:TetR/AcrR family transcriptional regulator [Spirochaeta dissipatitropha]
MPRSESFSRDDVIEAAWSIVEVQGFSGLSARAIADQLDCSVAPIYRQFSSIDELAAAVADRAFSTARDILEAQTGSHTFERIGLASLEFAQRYPVLFQELSLRPNQYSQSYSDMESYLVDEMLHDPDLEGWSKDEIRRLLFKMTAVHLGLAAMIANGRIPEWLSNDEVASMLLDIGEDVYRGSDLKRGENQNERQNDKK